MDHARVGVIFDRPIDQAILLVRPFARHRQEPGRFIENQQIAVLVKNIQCRFGHGEKIRWQKGGDYRKYRRLLVSLGFFSLRAHRIF
jgi:hypothetical protein